MCVHLCLLHHNSEMSGIVFLFKYLFNALLNSYFKDEKGLKVELPSFLLFSAHKLDLVGNVTKILG